MQGDLITKPGDREEAFRWILVKMSSINALLAWILQISRSDTVSIYFFSWNFTILQMMIANSNAL